MTGPEIEPRSPRSLANTLPTRPMGCYIYIYIYIYIYMYIYNTTHSFTHMIFRLDYIHSNDFRHVDISSPKEGVGETSNCECFNLTYSIIEIS